MLISEDIFRAFLRCETKSYLKFLGSTGNQREFTDWERNLVEDYKQQCCIQLRSNFREDECLIGTLLPQALENNMLTFPCCDFNVSSCQLADDTP